jgi:hypothetical protein
VAKDTESESEGSFRRKYFLFFLRAFPTSPLLRGVQGFRYVAELDYAAGYGIT